MKKISQKGFAHLALILLLVAVVAVIGVSYNLIKSRNSSTDKQDAAAPASNAQAVPAIKNTADLNTVEATLNSQDIEANLNPDNYNQDVQSLL